MQLTLIVFTTKCAKNFRRDGEKGVNYAHFVKNPFQGLNATAVASLMVIQLRDCTYHCINHKECYSINFAPVSFDRRHRCEVLNTDKFRSSDKLVYTDSFNHYHIQVSTNVSCSPTELHSLESDWVDIEFQGKILSLSEGLYTCPFSRTFKSIRKKNTWITFLSPLIVITTEQLQKSLDLS